MMIALCVAGYLVIGAYTAGQIAERADRDNIYDWTAPERLFLVLFWPICLPLLLAGWAQDAAKRDRLIEEQKSAEAKMKHYAEMAKWRQSEAEAEQALQELRR